MQLSLRLDPGLVCSDGSPIDNNAHSNHPSKILHVLVLQWGHTTEVPGLLHTVVQVAGTLWFNLSYGVFFFNLVIIVEG